MNIPKVIIGALVSLLVISGIYAATNITAVNTTDGETNCIYGLENCTEENCLCNGECVNEGECNGENCCGAQNRHGQNNNGECRGHGNGHKYGAGKEYCHNN